MVGSDITPPLLVSTKHTEDYTRIKEYGIVYTVPKCGNTGGVCCTGYMMFRALCTRGQGIRNDKR
jgi:hypothetical protein